MEKSNQALIGMAALPFSFLVAVTWYRWLQRQRLLRVEQWVRDYLSTR